MGKGQLSRLIASASKLHTKAKKNYRKGVLTKEEFHGELKRILSLLGGVAEVHGDSKELDDAKLCVWFSVESYDRDKLKNQNNE